MIDPREDAHTNLAKQGSAFRRQRLAAVPMLIAAQWERSVCCFNLLYCGKEVPVCRLRLSSGVALHPCMPYGTAYRYEHTVQLYSVSVVMLYTVQCS